MDGYIFFFQNQIDIFRCFYLNMIGMALFFPKMYL